MNQPTRSDSPTKTCTLDNCARPLRARGYCASHYNKIIVGEARRHPQAIVACVVCQAPVVRRVDSRYQPTCSTVCRSTLQWGVRVAQDSAYTWRYAAEKRARDAGCTIIESFERDEIFHRDHWICQDCGIKCSTPSPFDKTAATIDHVVPLNKHGNHSRANAQTLCLSCNSSKSDRVTSHKAA